MTISIHTLHTESDLMEFSIVPPDLKISIHTLHTESDDYNDGGSTGGGDFNPHSPYRE